MKCKDNLIAKAHQNPEFAKMSAKKLSLIIGVSQPTISAWRRKVKNLASTYSEHNRVLKSKVTVTSVRRKWEEKYMALSRQYDVLADRLIEMAKNADKHRNREQDLAKEVGILKSALEKKSWIQKLFNLKG